MSEYGDPDDVVMRKYILTYSSYHNVPEQKKLPAFLFVTAVQDDRVHPMHACKLNLGQKLSQSQQAVVHYTSDFVVVSKLHNVS